jgi:glycosyltransferase involved in cell wall biosynthesis
MQSPGTIESNHEIEEIISFIISSRLPWDMKVLHVHQIAHIPQLLVKHLDGKGLEAEFVENANASQVKNSDIVHGHYALNRNTIRAFRLARKHGVPFVLHCHGSDLRLLSGTGRIRLPYHYKIISEHLRKHSARILLSTPDLLEFEPCGEYVPNPVDLARFRPMPEIEKSSRHLICGKQVKGSSLLEFIKPEKEYDCVNTGYKFDFPPNVKALPYVDYSQFHEFLNRYEFMIGTVGDVISMARLEAMACGLQTFTNFEAQFTKHYDGQNPDSAKNPRDFIKQFHSPEIAVARLVKVYEEIMHP